MSLGKNQFFAPVWRLFEGESVGETLRRFLAFALLPLTILTAVSLAQGRFRISDTRVHYHYASLNIDQGQTVWAEARLHNGTREPLQDVKVRFRFFDLTGDREVFDQPLAHLKAGRTTKVTSPEWIDYSNADLGVEVIVYREDPTSPLATGKQTPK